jgi:succinate dehydrogenase/fumarate reductase cytochrome b subunit
VRAVDDHIEGGEPVGLHHLPASHHEHRPTLRSRRRGAWEAGEMGVDIETATDEGVAGNTRLTAATAAVLLVALAVEGATVLDVRGLIAVHLFVGLLLVPVTVLKLASTGWRIVRYYSGALAYRRKGPPHPILRVIGPLVALASVALLGTGVILLVVGPSKQGSWRDIHQASFVVWLVLMVVHVLGHVVDTVRKAPHDWRRSSAGAVRGARQRRSLVGASVVLGLALGLASLSWNHAWKNRPRFHDGLGVPASAVV